MIPTYNAARTLGRAIESALCQTLRPDEIVVVDDGSTDDTEAIMRPYLGRIRYVQIPHRGFPSAARNRGIAETCAGNIAFLDSDDWWYPGHLERTGQMLARRPRAGACYGNFEMRDEAGSLVRRVRARAVDGNGYLLLLRYNFFCTSTVVVPRACLERLGVFSESESLAGGCEDWELWLRIAKHYPIAHIPEALVAYRVHPPGGSLSTADRWFTSFQVMSRLILDHLQGKEKRRVAGWHDFVRARWYLAHGEMQEAHHMIRKSLSEFPALDRRLLFWLLMQRRLALRLPTRIRARLGIAIKREA